MSLRTGSRVLFIVLIAWISCLLAVGGATASEPHQASVGALGALLDATPSGTEDPTVTWGVSPADNAQGVGRPNYSYELEPGARVEDGFVVLNHSEKPLTLDIYVADSVVSQSGTLNLANRDVPPADVGSWVDVGVDEVTIGPGEEVEIPFTITVPRNASPGDHTGGILSSLTGADPAAITVERRLGSRIHVRVEGELNPGLRIDGLVASHSGSTDAIPRGDLAVSFAVTNSGNARMTGTAELRLRGPFGLAARVVPLDDLPELLPGSSYNVSVTVPDVPATVRMTATVAVTPMALGPDDATGTPIAPVEAGTTVWAMPWIPVGIVVLVLAWLAPRIVRRVRAWRKARRARRATGSAAAAKGSNDDAAANDEAPAAVGTPANDEKPAEDEIPEKDEASDEAEGPATGAPVELEEEGSDDADRSDPPRRRSHDGGAGRK